MEKFQFESDDIFVLIGRGITFRGNVISGSISKGERVTFPTKDGTLSAEVVLIQCNMKLLETTVEDEEIGLLLNNFDQSYVNDLITGEPGSTNSSLVELLKVESPVVLTAAPV